MNYELSTVNYSFSYCFPIYEGIEMPEKEKKENPQQPMEGTPREGEQQQEQKGQSRGESAGKAGRRSRGRPRKNPPQEQ
jgi:hypothetical protein